MRGGSEPRCNKKLCCLREQTFDGLKAATRRLLARIPDEATATNSPKRRQIRKAQGGTILVREWQGSTHRITVLDHGVAFNGRRYRSLSEVAREITWESLGGTRVSSASGAGQLVHARATLEELAGYLALETQN